MIGDGALGRAVAEIGRAFGMRVLFSAYKGTTGMGPLYTPFEEVLRVSDIITLHSPLLPSTRNMIAAPEFALMERRPLLINTARGGLVDEAALEGALRRGQIAGAGFDVATVEPPSADHPLMRVIDLPNFILTPHVAWASREAVRLSPTSSWTTSRRSGGASRATSSRPDRPADLSKGPHGRHGVVAVADQAGRSARWTGIPRTVRHGRPLIVTVLHGAASGKRGQPACRTIVGVLSRLANRSQRP